MNHYCIGITGHRPHKFNSIERIKTLCDDTVVIMKRHYGNELRFNLGGCTGADQWMGEACLRNSVKYNLYLPFPPEMQSAYWYDEQKEELKRQVDNCESLMIIGNEYNKENYLLRDKEIVDKSIFMVSFWEGAKYGGTYETIKYAVMNSKIILNATEDFRMLTMEDLERKKRYDNII